MAMYLGDDAEILKIFGFGEDTDIKNDDGLFTFCLMGCCTASGGF